MQHSNAAPCPAELAGRYAEMPLLVARDGRLTLAAKGLFSMLASYVGAAGCFPSQATLAAGSGCSVDTVQRCIAELVAAGHVVVKTRHDSRGLRVGVRYILTASAEMLHARASRQYVDLDDKPNTIEDTAPVRRPDTAPVRRGDTAPVRPELTSPIQQTLEPPKPPQAGVAGESGNKGAGPGPGGRELRRAEKQLVAAQALTVGKPCAVCGQRFTRDQVGLTWALGIAEHATILPLWAGRVVVGGRHVGCTPEPLAMDNCEPSTPPADVAPAPTPEQRAAFADGPAGAVVDAELAARGGQRTFSRAAVARVRETLLADLWLATAHDLPTVEGWRTTPPPLDVHTTTAPISAAA